MLINHNLTGSIFHCRIELSTVLMGGSKILQGSTTGMTEHELLKLRPPLKSAPAHLHLKGQTQKWHVLAHTLKVATSTRYKNFFICGVFLAKNSHTHSGDIRDLFYIL